MPDAQCPMPNARCPIPDAQFFLDIRLALLEDVKKEIRRFSWGRAQARSRSRLPRI
ncbi:MAG: hypothetical protein F6J93_34940 [Oscillatoria sp. SIO1A7]|nr:hypothetical protein [Oscillatoria sp. SIO1A7]